MNVFLGFYTLYPFFGPQAENMIDKKKRTMLPFVRRGH
jgi:hypothetical protein